MTQAKSRDWQLLARAAALAALGCNPYSPGNPAPPQIQAVFATNGAVAIDGSLGGGTWTVAIPSNVMPGKPPAADTISAVEPVIFVATNKVLDGSTIETVPGSDCTPKDGWLSAPPIAGSVWYSCYDPSSPTSLQGSSIVLFASPSPISPARGAGWFDLAALPGSDTGVTYSLSGNVADQEGRGLAISLSVIVGSPPGTPGPLAFTNVSSTTLTVSWTAPASSPVYVDSYTVQRTVDAGGQPNDNQWTTVGIAQCTGGGGPVPCTSPVAPPTTFDDTGLTGGTIYWYRVQATSNGATGHPTAATSVTTSP